MKQLIVIVSALVLFTSCRFKHVQGNGVITTQTRNATKANRIKMAGNFDVEITQGPIVSVQIEGDENLLPYFIVEDRGGYLVVKGRDYFSYSSTEGIKVFITTPNLEEVVLAGSGNIIGKSKFTGSDKLVLKIAGSGDIKMDVNTPTVLSEIAGTGSITLTGETKEETIKIAGVGDYTAADLKAENAKVQIAGSGDVKVFASTQLDVNIAGAGSVYYKGSPNVKQKVAGSGDVKKVD
jgi:hypothetical protein